MRGYDLEKKENEVEVRRDNEEGREKRGQGVDRVWEN